MQWFEVIWIRTVRKSFWWPHVVRPFPPVRWCYVTETLMCARWDRIDVWSCFWLSNGPSWHYVSMQEWCNVDSRFQWHLGGFPDVLLLLSGWSGSDMRIHIKLYSNCRQSCPKKRRYPTTVYRPINTGKNKRTIICTWREERCRVGCRRQLHISVWDLGDSASWYQHLHTQQTLSTTDRLKPTYIHVYRLSIDRVTCTNMYGLGTWITGWRPGVVDWGVVCLPAAYCGLDSPLARVMGSH